MVRADSDRAREGVEGKESDEEEWEGGKAKEWGSGRKRKAGEEKRMGQHKETERGVMEYETREGEGEEAKGKGRKGVEPSQSTIYQRSTLHIIIDALDKFGRIDCRRSVLLKIRTAKLPSPL